MLETPELTPGFGCLFSVEFSDVASARVFCDSLAVHKGPHLGTPSTLALAYVACAYGTRLDWAAGYVLKPSQIRITAGLEDTEMLIRLFKVAAETADEAQQQIVRDEQI